MGWFLNNIPKVVHFYWGGGKMPYLRYLTIESFHYYNPDWEIRFYFPQKEVREITWGGTEHKYAQKWEDWRPMIDTSYVKMIEIPWEGIIFENMSEVHRSDYIRWGLLDLNGGLWADMDILFFKPMNELSINTPANVSKKTIVSICGYGHSIGFMMSCTNNPTFKKMKQEALKMFNAGKYQSMGADLFNKLFPTIKSIPDSLNIGMDAVYFYNCDQMSLIFGNYPSPEDNPGSIGIHWYAGSTKAGDFLARTKGGTKPDNSVLGKIIRNYERNIYKNIPR